MLIADRVLETTTTTGTGDLTLAGAESGNRTFNTAFGTSVSFHYCCVQGSTYEIGIGHLSSSTVLVRDTILLSSTGSAINWPAGTKYIFNGISADLFKETATAGRVPVADSSGKLDKDWLDFGDYLELPEASTPSTPSSGNSRLYFDSVGRPRAIDDSGRNKHLDREYMHTLTDGASIDINPTNGPTQIVTLGGNRTITYNAAWPDGYKVEFWVKQDGTGSRTLTWPTTKWPTGTTPTLTATASKVDVFVIRKVGSDFFGFVGSQDH